MAFWDMQLMSTVYRNHVIPLPLSLTSLFGAFCFSLFWHFLLFSFSPRTSLYCTLFITNSTFIHLLIPISFSFLLIFFLLPPLVGGFVPSSFCAILFILTYKGGDASSSWLTPLLTSPWALSIHKREVFEVFKDSTYWIIGRYSGLIGK